MRIRPSDTYMDHLEFRRSRKKIKTVTPWSRHSECEIFEECPRGYCPKHRLLYRGCETAYRDMEGDNDVINGTRTFWNTDNECPECDREYKHKKLEREMREWDAEQKRREKR